MELVRAGARNFIVPLMLPDIIKSTREIGELFAKVKAEAARETRAVA
jgi:hypothetical protein